MSLTQAWRLWWVRVTRARAARAQYDLLRLAMEKMPADAQIVLALDHDEGGDKIAARIKAIFGEIEGAGRVLVLVEERPPTQGEDWNDVLRVNMGKSEPANDSVPVP